MSRHTARARFNDKGTPDAAAVAGLIDHTCVKPDATEKDVVRLCREARRFRFIGVCVSPRFLLVARRILAGSGIRLACVVDFPFGTGTRNSRVYEAMEAAALGADELDIVAPIGDMVSGKWERVRDDIAAVVMATPGLTHKIILETGFLSDAQKRRAASVCVDAGAEFVKTSTGFGPEGATAHDVSLLKEAVGAGAGVKASGGIRSYSDVARMARAGATRMGTSAGVSIMEELKARLRR